MNDGNARHELRLAEMDQFILAVFRRARVVLDEGRPLLHGILAEQHAEAAVRTDMQTCIGDGDHIKYLLLVAVKTNKNTQVEQLRGVGNEGSNGWRRYMHD